MESSVILHTKIKKVFYFNSFNKFMIFMYLHIMLSYYLFILNTHNDV